MTGVTFGYATPGDAEEVAALVQSAYRGDSGRQGWTLEPTLVKGRRTDAAAVRALIETAEARIVTASRDAGLVGCCLLERRDGAVWLGMLSVRPGLQRSGAGGVLVAEAERRAAVLWGAQRVDIRVLGQDEDLLAWYQRRGYEPTGTTTPFVPARGAVAQRPLHFVAMTKSLATR